MNKTISLYLTIILALGLIFTMPGLSAAQTCQGDGPNFEDLNGDGFNDNAPDDDGDGIPNGLDEDYVKPGDGSGHKYRKGNTYRNETANEFKNAGEESQNQHQVSSQYQGGEGTSNQYQYSNQMQNCEMDQNQEGIANQVKKKGDNEQAFKNQLRQFEGNGTTTRKQLRDGTGNGGNGTGICDGSGPKGKQNGKQ